MKIPKPAESKTKKRRGRSEIFCFKKSLTSLVVFVLLVSLNWAGLAAVGRTFGYFNDAESAQNSFAAGTLDFSLSGDDFSPSVSPAQNATSTIALQNDGLLDFIYGAKVENASGTLCDFLELEENINNTYQSLASFTSTTTMFSLVSGLTFDARLTSKNKSLQNQLCEFNFIFDGEQLEGAGFSDSEEISRTIASGEWPSVVINKVYYDVDDAHGGDTNEWKHEWIELYNPLSNDVDLKDWIICDNTNCKTINANVSIPALGFALLAHDNSVWEHYWDVPDDVVTINLGGSPSHLALNNDADMLVLKNSDGAVVDQMNWGTPNHSWANYAAYSAGIWEPGVADAAEGHLLARVPSGYDTDQVSDWQDLTLPLLTLDYPVGGETWYVGHTEIINWTATNPNGDQDNNKLSIDIYYSKNSGNTWAAIATSTQNDGSYDWHVPLFIEPSHYYVPSSHARIKVKATGPENFMVQAEDESEDFCPPIDYDALSPEDRQLVDQLISEGVIDENEVIRGGVQDEQQPLEITEESEITEEKEATEEPVVDETTQTLGSGSSSSAGVSGDDLSCPVGEAGTFNSVEQTGQDETIDETVDETAEEMQTEEETTEETIDEVVDETTEEPQTEELQEAEALIEAETLPETEIITEQSEEQTETVEQPAVQAAVESGQPPAGETTASDQETTSIETAPALEAQPAAMPSSDSVSSDGGGGDSGSGSGADSGAVAPADSGSAGE